MNEKTLAKERGTRGEWKESKEWMKAKKRQGKERQRKEMKGIGTE
jgi:hypothetical protein